MLKKELILYSIEKSDQASHKAEWFVKQGYLTDAPAKIFESVFCIVISLAYSDNFIELPNNISNVDIFFLWKSHRNKLNYSDNKLFATWLKQYTSKNIPDNKLYKIFTRLYNKLIRYESNFINNISKEDLIKDLTDAKDIIDNIKQQLYENL